MSAEYNIVKLFLEQGYSIQQLQAKFPQIGRNILYKYLRLYNLERYKKDADSLLYHSPEWKELRDKVIIRDGRKCAVCGSVKNLQLDHIVPKALRPDLLTDLTNLRLLCHRCHKKTKTYGRSGVRKTAKEAKAFLKKIRNS